MGNPLHNSNPQMHPFNIKCPLVANHEKCVILLVNTKRRFLGMRLLLETILQLGQAVSVKCFLQSNKESGLELCVVFPFTSRAPPVVERLCTQNWYSGGARSNPRSHLSIQLFEAFCVFHRNSCKYRLGSLGKTPTEDGRHTIGLNPSTQRNTILSQVYH